MHHSYIDRYADLDSFIHRIDPRVKIVVFFIYVISIVLTNPTAYLSFILYGTILLFLIYISKIPFLFILKKSLIIIPFVILIAIFIPFIKKGEVFFSYSFGSLKLEPTYEGINLFWGIVIKSYLSVLTMILLTSSTRFSNFLKGLEKLKMPKIFIMIISFMYRYLFLLIDEAQRMLRALESRSFGKRKGLCTIKILSNIVGVLFVRSYERGEKVYLSMCSRGFQGEIKTLDILQVKAVDILFLVSIVMLLFLIWLI